jgi:chemotaxis signal transduction protein
MSTLHARVRVAGEDYAIPVDDVLEVCERAEVTPVPGTRSEVLGVCNLRGQVVPVIDLATLLGLADEGERERIVVVAREGRRAGLAVETVVAVGSLPETTQEAESEYLSGATLFEDTLTGMVDVEAVLDAVTPEPVA